MTFYGIHAEFRRDCIERDAPPQAQAEEERFFQRGVRENRVPGEVDAGDVFFQRIGTGKADSLGIATGVKGRA